jgi:4-amino-4-deoxy-L-arabinose transferase-like glycosyltransferase
MDLMVTELRLSRTKAFFIAFLVWVAIYLPELGAHELRGEEARRVLPAVTMVKTGDWILPHVGGQAYYRKPPMINWLVGASFLLAGEQSERAARLPSALSTLAFVVLLIWLPDIGGKRSRATASGAPGSAAYPGIEARLIAALLFLASPAIIEKGRQIEIEGVYIAMTSLAVVSWLILWANHCGLRMADSGLQEGLGVNPQSEIRNPQSSWSAWALWLVPGVFLLFGMLTKGPPILIFFYAPVIAILAYSRRLRALISLPHLVSIALWLVIPAVWAYAASVRAAGENATLDIGEEVVRRLTVFNNGLGRWAENVVRSFTNLLPWGLFLPLLWRRDFTAHLPAAQVLLLKGARLGLVISFLAITLIPGNSPRYGLPVLGLMCVLLGWVLAERPELPDRGRLWRGGLLAFYGIAIPTAAAGFFRARMDLWGAVLLCVAVCLAVLVVRERAVFHTPIHLSLLSAVLVIVLTLQYVHFLRPLAEKSETYRPAAAKLNALVPSEETLYVFRPGYQPFLFYVREPLEYLIEPAQIDAHVRFLLMREDAYQQLKDESALALRQPRTVSPIPGRKFEFRLLELGPAALGQSPSATSGRNQNLRKKTRFEEVVVRRWVGERQEGSAG